jgi:toxin-antitoxin system PIN domain toxin
VFVPDVNVLLYATDASSARHAPCARWLAGALEGDAPVGFSWQVLLGFIRLATRAVVFSRPLSVVEAFDVVDDWLGRSASVVLQPTERHAAVLRGLLLACGTAGNLTSDAHLAALALTHGATLVSCDRDFGRFSGLKWFNPTAP